MTPEQETMRDNIRAAQDRLADEAPVRYVVRRHEPTPWPQWAENLTRAFANIGLSAADAARAFQRVGEQLAALAERDRAACASHAGKARWHARLAVRACCRAHGTTCPRCRRFDYHAPNWLVRLRDRFDGWRAVGLAD